MSRTEDFDVAVVGASVAGCTAARLFARAGARVALVEQRADPEAYKVTCTHAILPSATPTIERLGLAPLLEERGAVRTKVAFWTPYSGWLQAGDGFPDGWGVTRRTLDPMLRDLAAGTPGVHFLPCRRATGVLHDGERVGGVEIEARNHRRTALRAGLVVGADGRDSATARLARVPGRVRPHDRFFYFAYWRGVQPADRTARVWLMEPEGGALFPNEDGIVLLVAGFHRPRLAEVRADVERAYLRKLAELPDGPALRGAERISKVLGKLEMPNVIRPAAARGIAFVGDAALATDPLFGVGIGFALQSAEWLVDATSDALAGGPELDRALARYRRRFLWRLGPQHLQIADFSTGRPFRADERLTFRRAAADPKLLEDLAWVLVRERSPLRLLDPRTVFRVLVPAGSQPGRR